ncbi:MAG: hypothetical protein ACUVTQ_00550 [Desulfotomaculales bacterium]
MRPEDLVILALLVAFLLGWQAFRWWRIARVRRQARRARRGEHRAEQLLAAEGYRVIDTQVRAPITWTLGPEVHEGFVQADLLVARGRRRYVAEVKTGRTGREPDAETRRQLLEYHLAFPVHGVLLVDMERKAVLPVRFQTQFAGPRRAPVWHYLVAFGLGAVVAGLLGRH